MNEQILMKGWISCEDRLPETSKDVLVYDGEDMFVAWRTCWHFEENAAEMLSRVEEKWASLNTNFDPNTPILAWMPLPEPPSTVKIIKE